jgi:hypothetical protein
LLSLDPILLDLLIQYPELGEKFSQDNVKPHYDWGDGEKISPATGLIREFRNRRSSSISLCLNFSAA